MDAEDIGSDLSTFAEANGVADLDPTFRSISGPIIVVERIARKLQTPGGRLKIGWGIDLRELLQAMPSSAEQASWESAIVDQVLGEPEVADVDLQLDFDQFVKKTISLRCILTLRSGQRFPLVFVITETNVQPIFDDITNPGNA